jgi:hypothetical protein
LVARGRGASKLRGVEGGHGAVEAEPAGGHREAPGQQVGVDALAAITAGWYVRRSSSARSAAGASGFEMIRLSKSCPGESPR